MMHGTMNVKDRDMKTSIIEADFEKSKPSLFL